MKRKISALLAADIVKYSTLVAEAEEETVRRLADYRALCEDLASRHGGRVVNMVGDAVLAEFPSSVDAVRCALDMQEAMRARNEAYPLDRHMQVRIGVTLADIMDQDGELFGDGVNIAARLESLSPAGGICVSQTVREQAVGKVAAAFRDIGEQRVKNLPQPIRAYVIDPPGADAAVAGKMLQLRRGRVLAAVVVAAVAGTAGVTAVQFRDAPKTPASALPAAPAPSLAAIPAATGTRRFDEAKLRALAAGQSIPLPPRLRVIMPDAAVPRGLADYLGAWGGEQRWNKRGRQAMLIVESIDEAGTAIGVYAHGVPLNPNAITQNSARFVPFAATVTDKGLHFAWGRSNYNFLLMPDGSLWGQLDSNNERGHFELSIVLQRVE
ncbi:MAG TPA: adenylate/guanylate cyclase domain-containing protein [Xanthobacteraceae bacterium]|jgi:adenylate cyclase